MFFLFPGTLPKTFSSKFWTTIHQKPSPSFFFITKLLKLNFVKIKVDNKCNNKKIDDS